MKRWSLARQLFVGQLVFIAILTTCLSFVLYMDAARDAHDSAAERMLAVASTLAQDPAVLDGVGRANPTEVLQPYAVSLMDELRIDFITIMAPDRTRFTHRNPAQIGQRYIGSVDQALAGRSHTETSTGTLGPSVRAIAPVQDPGGTVVAMVAAGVTLDRVAIARNAQLPLVGLIALASLLFGSGVSYLLSHRLRKATLGLGTDELARMFVFYDSVLHSVREGLLLTDGRGRLVLYNDQAAHLLHLPEPRPQAPVPAAQLGVPGSLRDLLASGRQAIDEVHVTDNRVLVVNQEPAVPPTSRDTAGTRPLGTVTTLRDHTEIESLTGELQTMRTLTDALRAQTHEHSNRLHTIVSLIELDRQAEALEFATRDLQQSQQLTDSVVGAVDEPFIAALLVGKAAQANERGVELSLSVDGPVDSQGIGPGDLITIIGNLLDNAFDAAAPSERRRVRLSLSHPGAGRAGVGIVVQDSGPGLTDAERSRIFDLGFSTKDPAARSRGIGLALVRQAVLRLGGTLEVDNDVDHDGGARFSVFLPAVPPGATASANRAGP
ncbi:sensor histidine kinase [Arthrobacter sp. MSA 4-2]|uniref:sensor histidine kinase n=1 Tax=Arthrobacter sp. MSA 4-2 TaxID=2794349 RepID=UPI0027DAE336|nr:sensor histidine kinase [Arthrobacter sp. MSA 4-2]